MTFSAEINAITLTKALAAVKGAVDPKGPIPILNHVLLSAGEAGGMKLSACNLDQLTEVTIDGEAKGSVALHHGRLEQFAKYADRDRHITMVGSASEVVIKCGRSTLKLPWLAQSDFPTLEPAASAHSIELSIPAREWTKAGKFCADAASDNVSLYYLSGVHIENSDDGLIAAATDGSFMAVSPIEASERPTEPFSRMLRADAFNVPDGDALNVVFSNNIADIRAGSVRSRHKFIEGGKFPPWRRIIPVYGNDRIIECDTTELRDLVAGVSASGDNATAGIIIENEMMSIRCRSDDGKADADASIPVSWLGSSIAIGISARGLNDALSAIIARDGGNQPLHVSVGPQVAAPLLIRSRDSLALRVMGQVTKGFYLPGATVAGHQTMDIAA